VFEIYFQCILYVEAVTDSFYLACNSAFTVYYNTSSFRRGSCTVAGVLHELEVSTLPPKIRIRMTMIFYWKEWSQLLARARRSSNNSMLESGLSETCHQARLHSISGQPRNQHFFIMSGHQLLCLSSLLMTKSSTCCIPILRSMLDRNATTHSLLAAVKCVHFSLFC